MFYTVYVTTNNINGKKYIGKHVTDNLDDGYLGSGKILNSAIKKYGRDNFSKKILFICDNEDQMNNKEKEMITPEVILSEDYYNIACGGEGGVIVLKPDHPLYDETRQKISKAQQSRSFDMSRITKENHKLKRVGMYGKSQSDYQKQVVSNLMKGKPKSPEAIAKQRLSFIQTLNSPGYVHPNTGKKRGEGHKEKMSAIIKSRPPKTCIHCGKVMNAGNYARYHGDKCNKRYEDAIEKVPT